MPIVDGGRLVDNISEEAVQQVKVTAIKGLASWSCAFCMFGLPKDPTRKAEQVTQWQDPKASVPMTTRQ